MSSTPRISTNDLAQFMVATPTGQIGIVKRAKYPQTPPLIRYRDAKQPLITYLTDPARSVNPLVVAEQMFQQRAADPSETSLRQDDALKSIEVVRGIHQMANQMAAFTFIPAPHKQTKLSLGGVVVSVHADLLVHGASRGVSQIGAALFRMTQVDSSTETAIARRREMGLYVATLARLHLDHNFTSDRAKVNRLCMSIDVQHGEVFAAPAANARRISDLTAACQMIAALWPGL